MTLLTASFRRLLFNMEQMFWMEQLGDWTALEELQRQVHLYLVCLQPPNFVLICLPARVPYHAIIKK